MAKLPFLERLKQDAPLLTDGAMGTMLHARGASLNTCFDELNLTNPQLVAQVHRDYIDVGAELIETNTFSANRYKLREYGLEDRVAEINRAGATLAQRVTQEIGREHVYVAGSVGSLGVGLQPYGRISLEQAQAAFAEQIAALAAAGVDVILMETFNSITEIKQALLAAQQVAPELPTICLMNFTPDDRTLLGELPGRVAHELAQAGATVIGANCSAGPAQLTRVAQMMRSSQPNMPVAAIPNAGFPETVGGRMMYPATGDYFADYALTFKAVGVCLIGGCCGTTPDHIGAMRQALDNPNRPLPHIPYIEINGDEEEHAPEHPTEMARKLAGGEFITSVEMNPPRSHSLNKVLASAGMLRDAGADVLNVPDSPTARMRMSPWAVCQQLQIKLGMETILHFPTRGRNLLRIQGDLLGAHAMGLRNLFVCMGDPTRIGDYPDAMDTYDIVPSGLIRLVKQRLNQGVDEAGNSIGQPTTFNVGCALNMGAADIDKEIRVLRKKIEGGADFALGQAVFDPAIIETFHKRYEEIVGEPLSLPVLLAIMPLYSARHAHFLDNEVPGINIPGSIMTRIESAGEEAKYEGVRIAQTLLHDMRGMIQGAYVIPAFGHYELAADVIDSLAVVG